jgi:hypothetical protein
MDRRVAREIHDKTMAKALEDLNSEQIEDLLIELASRHDAIKNFTIDCRNEVVRKRRYNKTGNEGIQFDHAITVAAKVLAEEQFAPMAMSVKEDAGEAMKSSKTRIATNLI